jgi:hypothetical protein
MSAVPNSHFRNSHKYKGNVTKIKMNYEFVEITTETRNAKWHGKLWLKRKCEFNSHNCVYTPIMSNDVDSTAFAVRFIASNDVKRRVSTKVSELISPFNF